MESRDPNKEQLLGVSVGLIQVQESLLGPGAAGGAQSHLSTGVPRTAAGDPQRDRELSTQIHRVSQQLLLDSPWDALLSSESTQSCGSSTEPGSAQSRTALNPSSCLMHPSGGSRDQDQPRSPWMRQQQRWSHSNLLRPSIALTPPTHPIPLGTALSQPQGCREGRELRKCFPSVGKCCQCFIRDSSSKIPPTRNSPVVAAPPGDALAHDQNGTFRGQVRTRRGDRWVWMQNQVKRIDFSLGVNYKEQKVVNSLPLIFHSWKLGHL